MIIVTTTITTATTTDLSLTGPHSRLAGFPKSKLLGNIGTGPYRPDILTVTLPIALKHLMKIIELSN